MAGGDAAAGEAGDGARERKNFWASSAAAAKGASAVAFSFFAVLTLAAFLFVHHRHERAGEIDQELAQNAARLGREVELKYKTYRNVVDNVTRIMTQAATATAAVREQEVTEATSALEQARKREQERLETRDRATQRRRSAEDRRRRATALDAASRDEETRLQTAYATAQEKATTATKLLETSIQAFNEQAAALVDKQALLDRTTKAVDDAQKLYDETKTKAVAVAPSAESPAVSPPTEPPASAPPPAAVVDAREKLDEALALRQKAEHELLRAKTALEDAERRANGDIEEAQGRNDVAQARLVAWDAAAATSEHTALEAASAAGAAKQAGAASAKAATNLQTTRAEKKQTAQKLADAANPRPETVTDRYLDSLKELVLPSQRSTLDVCKTAHDNNEQVNVCVAQQLLILNEASDIEIDRCETASPVPSVSRDGRYLLVPPTSVGPAGTLPPACGRVKLSRFLSADDARGVGTSPPADRVFEAVLLLRRDGAALFVRDPSSTLRISALPGFEAKRADATGMLKNVDFGANKYRAYLQPVRLRLESSGRKSEPTEASSETREHADLVVVGLAREDRLDKESLAISLPYYLWFVLLLALGLLSLPLAKLWLLGPKTTFQRFDVSLLVTSTLLFTLLGTTLVLAFFTHNRLAAREDAQLEAVANTLSGRIADQIRSSAHVLDAFRTSSRKADLSKLLPRDGGHASVEQQKQCALFPGGLASRVLFDGGVPRTFCEVTRFELSDAKGDSWKHVFALDKDGNERLKLTQGEHNTTAVSVRSRPYFKAAIRTPEPEIGCVGPSDDPCKSKAVPEFVRAVTSGDLVLIVAQPLYKPAGSASSVADRPTDDAVGVLAVETDMSAFRSLVLPLGIEAAVIDARGNVMLHSDNDAHEEQSLLEEVDAPDELRAALAAKVATTMSLRYLGQPSRIHITPLLLPDVGWSAVTIEPDAIVDVATVDTVVLTLFSYGSLVAVIVLCACSVLVVRRFVIWLRGRDLSDQAHAHPDDLSLRPQAHHSSEYATLGIWTLRTGAVLCAVALLTTGIAPTSVLLAATLLAAALAFWRFGRVEVSASGATTPPQAAAEPLWRGFLPLTYLLCIAGLAEIFVMAPTAVLFAGAHDHVVDTLARAELTHFGTLLRNREKCLQTLSAKQPPPGSGAGGCSNVFGSGEEHGAGNAGPDLEGAPPKTKPSFLSSSLFWPEPALADLLPRVGSSESEDGGRLYRIQTVGRERPNPTSYVTVRDRRQMFLTATKDDHVVAAMDVLPLVGADGHYHWYRFAALVLIAGAAMAASYTTAFHSLRRLFFIDLLMKLARHKPVSVDVLLAAKSGASAELPRRLLCLYPTAEVRAALKEYEAWPVDAGAACKQDAADTLRVVGDFDTQLEDPENAKRLRQLAGSAAIIVLLAEQDPFDRLDEKHRREWVAALEPFRFVELVAPAATGAPRVESAPSPATVEHLWLESSPSERRCLAQIAIGGYATPHPANKCALQKLAARGLIRANTLTIVHDELAEHARQATSPEEQATWSDADKSTNWAALRVPLTTGVASLLAAVAASNPELGFASAVVPTLTAGLPSVLKMLLPLRPRG